MAQLIYTAALWDRCDAIGLGGWRESLQELIETRMSITGHGDFARWSEALATIKNPDNDEQLREGLLALSPWRKGPFDVGGVHIDSEWQSNLKWARIADRIAPLAGRHVLDVGSGNGYYALQMRAAGAETVIGVDPTILFVMQFLAVNHYVGADNTYVLPLRLEDLPAARCFDTTFSMGVLYHRRSPIDHLNELRAMTRPGGQLVLETLILPGEEAFARTPESRYARMRNVWSLPSIPELTSWLGLAGFADIDVIDVTATTTEEQRSTDWMTFESLAQALDPKDPTLTVEGWPAPIRASVLATAT